MKRTYRIGIDVGLNSCGLAAIEVDDEGMPIRILNAQSVIHDGGVDPSAEKAADSRKKVAGMARRTRRLRRQTRRRLNALDDLLRHYGYPIVNEENLTEPFEIWKDRAALADDFIADETERKRLISIACRHIARHRGWRNPYHNDRSLLGIEKPQSEQYQQLRENAMNEIGGEYIAEDATPAQIVRDVVENDRQYGTADGKPSLRIRTSTGSKRKGDRAGLMPTRLMQEDNAYELEKIFRVQQVPEEQAKALLLQVFHANSPKGSAKNKRGKDPFDRQERAMKASIAFQRYRIANVITNLRIKRREDAEERPLTVEEKQKVFNYLADSGTVEPAWGDVAELIGIARNELKGVGKQTADGEDRVSNRPPQIETEHRIAEIKNSKLRKALQKWWNDAERTDAERESMAELLSNTVNIDEVQELPEYSKAIEFIDNLDDKQLQDLEKISLPIGRAAYSIPTLRKLTKRMLETDDDLQAARKHCFGVDDSWRPPQPPIGEPIGNPAVDRVLKIVNRYLLACQKRWGDPQAVQIEHTREAFSSVATARKTDYENNKRYEERQDDKRALAESEGIDHPTSSDVRRWRAITRQQGITQQNSQCLYCGREITFKTCEMDHIVPRKGAGSTNTRDNFAAVCAECNRMKSNMPFAVWAQTPDAQKRGVSLEEAIERVRWLIIDPREIRGPVQQRKFKNAIIRRLKQTEADDPIDNRSIESVAWMADELHRRIDWYFNSQAYGNAAANREAGQTKVAVFPGSVTAEARKASGIEGQIHFIGAQYKTRIDRRHHAVDASVIAMMNPGAAQTLIIRQNLRTSQRAVNRLHPGEIPWKEYPTETDRGYETYSLWEARMHVLLNLLNDALDNDRIPVVRWQRLSLGNSLAHDATIHSLKRKRLGEAISAEEIRKSATPAQWCALTCLPDYSSEDGLPKDSNRSICINGKHLTADDYVEFFDSTAAQLKTQKGSADIGSAIHHARIYRYYTMNKKGARKYAVGMIRVFQVDLLCQRQEDLFTCPLPPQSISMRYGDPKVAQAVLDGRAEYLGWLVIGDELDITVPQNPSGQFGEFCQFFQQDADVNPAVTGRWVVKGFFNPLQLRLQPMMLASEGLDKLQKKNNEITDEDIKDLKKVMKNPGWLPAVNALATMNPITIRRNAFGEIRWKSRAGLPVSWRWQRE